MIIRHLDPLGDRRGLGLGRVAKWFKGLGLGLSEFRVSGSILERTQAHILTMVTSRKPLLCDLQCIGPWGYKMVLISISQTQHYVCESNHYVCNLSPVLMLVLDVWMSLLDEFKNVDYVFRLSNFGYGYTKTARVSRFKTMSTCCKGRSHPITIRVTKLLLFLLLPK